MQQGFRRSAWLFAAVFLVLEAGSAQAGSLEPFAGQDNASSAMYTLQDLYNRLTTGAAGFKRTGGFAEPAAVPGATGQSLDGIMALMPAADNDNGAAAGDVSAGRTFWGLRTDGNWGPATGILETRTVNAGATAQQAGLYATFDLAVVDPDLAAANIRSGVSIFGIAGNSFVANTASATATAADIECGKTAYIKGVLVTGTDCPDLCPDDPYKMAPGICGCGVPDTDSDGDGVPDCIDQCPNDPDKTEPGQCGCSVPDYDFDGDGVAACFDMCDNNPNLTIAGPCGCQEIIDSDGDGVPDCLDECPNDSNKVYPGLCGCGVPDDDTDGDGYYDCQEVCIYDHLKLYPGVCGCGVADIDTDGDGVPDCIDKCPLDFLKTEPGVCGCGTVDNATTMADSDDDGVPDCIDGCPHDPYKTSPGVCGCGNPDTDTDGDGVPDCIDRCPLDHNKTSPGLCGCGVPDTDTDGDGVPDCNDKCPYNPTRWNTYGTCVPGPKACNYIVKSCNGGNPKCMEYCNDDPMKYPDPCQPCPTTTSTTTTTL